MKAKIDETGRLILQRGSKMKCVMCPYGFDFCNDDCSLFQEPIYDTVSIELKLCKKTYYFNPEDFEDLRE